MERFKFLGISDCGESVCPCCGADGRYIYEWEEDGVRKAAMAGCFKRLTSKFTINDNEKYFINLFEKQSKNKKLNGWDKNILRLLQFKKDKKYPDEWCDKKINEVLIERNTFLYKREKSRTY